MRLSYNKEDLIIGFFIIFAISYPLLTALLIFLQDVKEKEQEMQRVRAFYNFLFGLEECKRERAEELLDILSEELAKDIGGVDGLFRTCESYRKAYPDAKVEEKLMKDGEVMVMLVRKEKGMTQRLLFVKVYYDREGKDTKIKRLEYEKGS